jgi:hypothetical protein
VESDVKNLEYRQIIKNFHNDFFINRKLQHDEYSALDEIVDDYTNIVVNLNRSRLLFKELESESGIDSQDSIMILLADKDSFGNMDGKMHGKMDGGGGHIGMRKYKRVELHDKYQYDDLQLDDESQNLANDKSVIIEKMAKLTKKELKVFSKLSASTM